MSINNWRKPKSEKMLAFEELLGDRMIEARTTWPHLSDDEVADLVVHRSDMEAAFAEIKEEFLDRLIDEVIDEEAFNFLDVRTGERKFVLDKTLLEMPDTELAAWAQERGLMFAQVKAHLAVSYPETKLRVISGGAS